MAAAVVRFQPENSKIVRAVDRTISGTLGTEGAYRILDRYGSSVPENGRGEFDMKIQLHFVDKATQPHVLDHDLNFQLSHYEVSHTLIFKLDLEVSFLKLLKPASDYHSDSQVS
ncbi:hypothetical protein BGZ73_000344, partial [Actinomortierella ambigua]